MIGRVSFNSGFDLNIRNMQQVTSRYHTALTVAGSGKRVNAPADDPASYTHIQAGRTTKQQYADYQNGIGTAFQEMQQADSVLSSAVNDLSRARELAVNGSTAGFSAADLAAMSQEISAIFDDVVQIANSRFNNRYLFSGNQTSTAAYDATGVYQGDAGVRSYIAGLNLTLPINQYGDQVFGTASGGVDIFATLTSLQTALTANNPTAVQATLDDLDQGIKQLNSARSIYGARANQADDLHLLYDDQTVQVTEQISNEEDADVTSAYSDVARLSTALQASLQVSANTSKLSLLNYI